jgi:cytochrome c-type biogenesis protein CcmF
VGIAFAVFWGTIFPILSEAVRGPAGKVTVGPPFFNKVTGPLFLILLLFMAAGPLLPWRKASTENLRRNLLRPLGAAVVVGIVGGVIVQSIPAGLAFAVCAAVVFTVALEFYRGTRAKRRATGYTWPHALVHLIDGNHGRYGGYIVHLGLALLALGLAGSTILKVDSQATVRMGQSIAAGAYRATPVRVVAGTIPNVGPSWTATVEVTKNGQHVATMTPTLIMFQQNEFQQGQAVGEVALRSTPLQDMYITLVEPSTDLKTVRLHVLINPLLWWIWAGGLVIIVGGFVSFTPNARERRATVLAGAEAPVGVSP